MKFNVVCGLPRSGSTLLCNILNQNSKFHASSTSPIAGWLGSTSMMMSNSPEIKGDLLEDKKATEEKIVGSTKAFIEGWYKGKDIVFDKSRGWGHHALVLRQVFPESKMILCIRDLRAIFGSIEKQNRKNPMLDYAVTPEEKTMYTRADKMFSPQGIVGMPLNGIEDLLRKNLPGVITIQYENLVKNPKLVMERIYTELGEDYYKHDFENIKNTANDPDALYLNKFPHEGSGKVVDSHKDEWEKYVSQDVAELIMKRYSGFNQVFGY